MSERPPGRDPLNTIRTFGVSYHLNRRFARITPTQKSVTSGNPPSKQFWFITIPTAALALWRCLPVVLCYVSANLLINATWRKLNIDESMHYSPKMSLCSSS